MQASKPETPPILINIGLALFESMMGGSVIERFADLAAVGADAGVEEDRAKDTFRHNLRNWLSGTRQPQPEALEAFGAAVQRGVRHDLQKATHIDEAQKKRLSEQMTQLVGPFTSMTSWLLSPQPNIAQSALLDFSENIDCLGAKINAAVDADNLDVVKDLVLGANWLNESYWIIPEPGHEDPRQNRDAMRQARSWHEVVRAFAPLTFNATLSWLSRLDLAVLTGGADQGSYFPLFLPLSARLKPSVASAQRKGEPLPDESRWSGHYDLPVSNLIKMLKNITSEINDNIRKRGQAIKPHNANKGDQFYLHNKLKELRRHDLLNLRQFNEVLDILKPEAVPGSSEWRYFDLYSLYIATNLFALFTLRDGKMVTNKRWRGSPGKITVFDFVAKSYEAWWRRNLLDLVGDVIEHPRPNWFNRSLGDRGDAPQ